MIVELTNDGRKKLKSIQNKFGKKYNNDTDLVNGCIDGIKNNEVTNTAIANILNWLNKNNIESYFIALYGDSIGLIVLTDNGNIKCSVEEAERLKNEVPEELLLRDQMLVEFSNKVSNNSRMISEEVLDVLRQHYVDNLEVVDDNIYNIITEIRFNISKDINVVKGLD